MHRLTAILSALMGLALVGQPSLPLPRSSGGSTFLQPGRPQFRIQSVREGLPHNSINAIAQDAQGRLWIGTQDGAASYNGQQWTVVTMPQPELSNFVQAVLPAADGSTWFGLQTGGVTRLNRGAWTQWGPDRGLPAIQVNALLQTPDGTIWAATYGAGLMKWDGRAWSAVPLPLRSPRLWKLTAALGDPDAFWVCGEKGTLVRVKEGTPTEEFAGLPDTSINQVVERRVDGGARELWVSTYGGGVGRHREGAWTFFRKAQGLPDDYCTDFAETRDAKGAVTLWAATLGGLAYLEPGATRWKAHTLRAGLPTETIYRLFANHPPGSGNMLWIGTGNAGLASLHLGGWSTHDGYSGLQGHSVFSPIELDRPGGPTVLVATRAGLQEFDGSTWREWDLPPGLRDRRMSVVALFGRKGPNPALWVGGQGALGRWQAGRWTAFGAAQGLLDSTVWALGESTVGGRPEIWAGTRQGALVLEGEHWRSRNQALGIPPGEVTTLETSQDSQGVAELWMGVQGQGVVRIKGSSSLLIGRDHGLPNTSVVQVHLRRRGDGRRELWVGTMGGGAAVYDADRPDRPPELLSSQTQPALLSPFVLGIAETPDGGILLATQRGLARVQDQKGQPRFAVRYFTEDDGLASNFCNPRSILVDSRQRIWVATRSGLGVQSLDHIPEEPSASPLRLNRLWVNGEVRHRALEEPSGAFDPQERRLAFGYTLMAFHGDQAIQYRTQLTGMEAQATEWSTANQRQFGVLPPGSYTFSVWARDARGKVVGPIQWPFRIQATLWERAWFRWLLALATLGAAAGILRWRLRFSRLQTEALKRLVRERTAKLEQVNQELRQEARERHAAEGVKDEFTALVSHELRTPLTAVRGALGLMEAPALEARQRQEMHAIATRNTERLLKLVNDLLDMRKIEQGHLDLEAETVPLGPALEAAIRLNQPYASQFDVALVLAEPFPRPDVWADPLRLEQVLANLLSNAIKYSPAGGKVHLGAEARGPEVRIWVLNHGEPIPEAFRDRIFEKFAQAETGDTRTVKGTGLGLAISKAIVEGLGGRMGFESAPGATTFWFELRRG